jgi:hypothetical protein
MPANHCPSGARTDGCTPTIRAAGFNGIADIIWDAECRRKTFDRSGVGRQCDDTSGRSNFTASPVTRPAANASDRLFFTGPMIVENYDPSRVVKSGVMALVRFPRWVKNGSIPGCVACPLHPSGADLIRLPAQVRFVPNPDMIARAPRGRHSAAAHPQRRSTAAWIRSRICVKHSAAMSGAALRPADRA